MATRNLAQQELRVISSYFKFNKQSAVHVSVQSWCVTSSIINNCHDAYICMWRRSTVFTLNTLGLDRKGNSA